ncbi:MAG: vWA domain-containing protein [Planctomycetota bacterium]|jgi:Ca-activated chloride channel family protein
MSDSPEEKHDELGDRLMDQALREVLGGEAPPELSDRILAAVEKQGFASPQRKERVMHKSKRSMNWVFGAAAACVMVGATIAFLLPAGHHNWREVVRRNDVGDEKQPSLADRLAQVERSHVPFPDEPTIAYPDPQFWQEVTVRRKENSSTGDFSGKGPGRAGDRYGQLVENAFRAVKDHPLSTFSIDVDTASYANVRRFLLDQGRLPPPDAVRIEELINYFRYDYAGPEGDVPFAAHIAAAACPWKPGHRLVRIGLKGREFPSEQRPESNLVFLLDVSGSMRSPDKLPLLKRGMKLLAEQMRENDRVAIVVYASSEGLVLPSTSGERREEILAALDRLEAGGSTNGGAGIELAYRIAQENLIPGGVNRVLLCTDGDFNVGTTSTGALVRMVEERARSGVFLSVLGFGRGNLNDAMMETISNKGNGNYAYIDSISEARKVLVEQMGGTLITIAKDVKIQVEFNPARVAAYRLIGYENRILAAEDFGDDRKDAGEIGAGHTVTALYEVVPAGTQIDVPIVDPLKYQSPAQPKDDAQISDELLTLKLRYKEPDAATSKLLQLPLVDEGRPFGQASTEFQFAAAVASFGMLLRDSEHKGTATYDAVLEIATAAKGPDVHGYRAEFLEMVRQAKTLTER